MTAKKVSSRKFLNDKKDGGIAVVSWNVETYTNESGAWCELKLTDCHRLVTLDFSFNPSNYESRIKKIDLLLSEIQALKAAMIKANEPRPKKGSSRTPLLPNILRS